MNEFREGREGQRIYPYLEWVDRVLMKSPVPYRDLERIDYLWLAMIDDLEQRDYVKPI